MTSLEICAASAAASSATLAVGVGSFLLLVVAATALLRGLAQEGFGSAARPLTRREAVSDYIRRRREA